MSNIGSSAYPVITVTKSGDQFAVVQNGQLKKLTRDGLAAFISELAPNTILSLSDTPNSFVGQQGKGLVVNATENAMEFAPTVSSNYLALTDTPSSYGGQATKIAVVKADETGMEFIENFFIKLGDTPVNYTGASKNIVRVNAGATGVEFVTPTEAAPPRNLTGGWFDIDNSAGSQAYSSVGTFVKVINNALGPDTRSDFAPLGITTVYDGTVSQFDFTQLAVGDVVTVRVDMDVTTSSANQAVSVNMQLAIGGTPFSIALYRSQFKTAGTYQVTPESTFYIGETVQPNAAEVQFRSDATATLNNVGWFVKVTRLGAL